jgi:hypothetical protein
MTSWRLNGRVAIVGIAVIVSVTPLDPLGAARPDSVEYHAMKQAGDYQVLKEGWKAGANLLSSGLGWFSSVSVSNLVDAYFNDPHTRQIIADVGSRTVEVYTPFEGQTIHTRGALFEVYIFSVPDSPVKYLPNSTDAVRFVGEGATPVDAMINRIKYGAYTSIPPSGLLKDNEHSWYVWTKYDYVTGSFSFQDITYPENLSLVADADFSIQNKSKQEVMDTGTRYMEAQKPIMDHVATLSSQLNNVKAELLTTEAAARSQINRLERELTLQKRVSAEDLRAQQERAIRAEEEVANLRSAVARETARANAANAAEVLARANAREAIEASTRPGGTTQGNGAHFDGDHIMAPDRPSGGQVDLPSGHWSINGRDQGESQCCDSPH